MVMTSRSCNDGNNITIVMIVIIIVFFECQAPIIIVFSTSTFVELFYYGCTKDLFYFVSMLLRIMNSSVNFIIYCVFRRQFRNQLCLLFGRVCGCPWQQHPARQPNDDWINKYMLIEGTTRTKATRAAYSTTVTYRINATCFSCKYYVWATITWIFCKSSTIVKRLLLLYTLSKHKVI